VQSVYNLLCDPEERARPETPVHAKVVASFGLMVVCAPKSLARVEALTHRDKVNS
jgi:hypothetical protein